jgi:exonuclease III
MEARAGEEIQFRIATLNINQVTSRMRIGMLAEFLRDQAIDVIFGQQGTQSVLDNVWGYTACTNLGVTHRGTAFIARDHLELQEITCLSSGRSIVARLRGGKVGEHICTIRGGATAREGGISTL